MAAQQTDTLRYQQTGWHVWVQRDAILHICHGSLERDLQVAARAEQLRHLCTRLRMITYLFWM